MHSNSLLTLRSWPSSLPGGCPDESRLLLSFPSCATLRTSLGALYFLSNIKNIRRPQTISGRTKDPKIPHFALENDPMKHPVSYERTGLCPPHGPVRETVGTGVFKPADNLALLCSRLPERIPEIF